MNGRIRVRSKPNKGSKFLFVLKNIQISEKEVTNNKSIQFDFKEIHFQKATILIIDDIESNRKMLSEWLSHVGLTVIEAEDGIQGVEYANNHLPDLILMDVIMPNMDGLEATEKIKQNPKTSNIPVIILTASYMDIEKLASHKNLFESYLLKPIKAKELFYEIAKFLKTHIITKQENPSLKNEPKLNKKELGSLRTILKKEFLPRLEELCTGYEMNEITLFAQDLLILGEKYQHNKVTNYAKGIIQYAENFDIRNLMINLNQFLELMNE